MPVREDFKIRGVSGVTLTHILIISVIGGNMFKAVATETRKMEDNQGKPYYLHIEYDRMGNPIRRQVSRLAQPTNTLNWQY